MPIKVINLVDSLRPMNFGIWNAAISTADELYRLGEVQSELWVPDTTGSDFDESIQSRVDRVIGIGSRSEFERLIKMRQSSHGSVVVVSHGSWRTPTRWSKRAKMLGARWIYTPQGMLEPWSLRQKRIRKSIYFRCLESKAIESADVIRAVSRPEQTNLNALFPNLKTKLIPNGIEVPDTDSVRSKEVTRFVFLGRLHSKKSISPLVEAFCGSRLRNLDSCELLVAGPDQGELASIKSTISQTSTQNIRLLGPVFGDQKTELFDKSHFFVLPSHSEGFPTAALEAISRGCIPIISSGCNFPEADEANLTIPVTPDVESIGRGIMYAYQMDQQDRDSLSQRVREFVAEHYTIRGIAAKQFELLQELTNTKSVDVTMPTEGPVRV